MDTHGQAQQQKDFMSAFFPPQGDNPNPNVDHSQHHQNLFNGQGLHPGMINTGMQALSNMSNGSNITSDMDMLQNLMAMQGMESHSPLQANQQAPYNPSAMLEQQFKLTQLQQLQQLQNQIFQQQIAIISGQQNGQLSDLSPNPQQDQRPSHHQGLPTPVSSSELRPQQSNDYVSPMILQGGGNINYDLPPQSHTNHTPQTNSMSHPHQSPTANTQYHHMPQGSSSAPANIAFQSLSSDLDFDISPLTSPWMGPNNPTSVHPPTTRKRTASPGNGEDPSQPSRKRQSPAIRPTNPGPPIKKPTRGSKSTITTPLMRSTRPRRNSTTVAEGDTPSPVDLSMPPPTQPASSSSLQGGSMSISPRPDLQITPVTPASIMNLGRLGLPSGLTPIPQDQVVGGKKDTKGKGAARPKSVGEPPAKRKAIKKSESLPMPSPGLKPIRPAGDTPSLQAGPSASYDEPPRKNISHKAAEQKRRDSLKTTFDDLRHLLPPIPLPSDENFPDEPILPGALPPRGPPKAGGEGPNKGVSKLQLLRCGNDFIRQLKGRVERRDEEIDNLRREIMRLRIVSGYVAEYGEDEVDLERDIDAVEANQGGLGRGSNAGDDDADEDDGE